MSPAASGAAAEEMLAEAFRQAGWRVERQPPAGQSVADLLVRRGKHRYLVELKYAPEGRRDRLIPLLSQAILQIRRLAQGARNASPLAVVVAPRIPAALAEAARRFASENAPDVAVGVMSLDGFYAFFGPGLEELKAKGRPVRRAHVRRAEARPNLFSDLNQWMLKVLLAHHLPEELISAPRAEYHNVSELARASRASVMSAFRLVRQLSAEGFLDDSEDRLRLVRLQDLMWRWRSASQRSVYEWPARWILKGASDSQLQKALASYAAAQNRQASGRGSGGDPLPRACLALFAAADALGLGFVKGVKPHLYVEQIREEALRHVGLIHSEAGEPVDVIVRIPSAPESVFRGIVMRKEVPVCDVLQVYLDVSFHPARGQALAAEIERQVLGPVLAKR